MERMRKLSVNTVKGRIMSTAKDFYSIEGMASEREQKEKTDCVDVWDDTYKPINQP